VGKKSWAEDLAQSVTQIDPIRFFSVGMDEVESVSYW